LSVSESRFTFRDEQGFELTFTAPLVTGKVARRQPIALDDSVSSATTPRRCRK